MKRALFGRIGRKVKDRVRRDRTQRARRRETQAGVIKPAPCADLVLVEELGEKKRIAEAEEFAGFSGGYAGVGG